MCGIAGFVDLGATIADPHAVLQAMAACLRHRGPDDDGTWFDDAGRVGLAFRRLAIQDLKPTGHQPMASARGRFTIVYNGEIYNVRELRAELERAGVAFRGSSDTEVLLALIERDGVSACLPHLVGMFAFAVWDARERELTLVRDRLGVKPLYVGFGGADSIDLGGASILKRGLVFASELKAFRAHPQMRFDLDRAALALYVRHAYVPMPWSIHRSIRKLPPGHLLRVRDGRTTLECYWSAKAVAEQGAAQPFLGDDEEAIDAVQALLDESVRGRMIADVPLGAFLSGGVDSSAVVAAMSAVAPGQVRTFTIGVRDPVYDEAPFARAIAAHLGTQHTERYVEPDDALAVIPMLADVWDEPFADSSQIPTYIVSRIAREHVTVILSGDGGDEVFGGYERYRWVQALWRRLRWLPSPARASAARLLRALPAAATDRAIARLAGASASGDRARKLADLMTARDPWEIFHRLTSVVQAPADLLVDGHEAQSPLTDPAWLAQGDDALRRMMQADLVSYLVDDILVKVDRASMAHGLEAREPLLDHRLVEFAFRLPTTMKLRRGTTKWVLRAALERRVPRQLFERPKRGFAVPLERWLVGPLRDWAEDLLDERRLRDEGVFRPEAVRALWSALQRGERVQHRLWTVLMFQAWQARWGRS